MIALHAGDCLRILNDFESNSLDALVCDPPAGIGFMGKDWDKDRGGRAAWVAYWALRFGFAWRVMKPGAHGLVWALPRTSHWTATALEDAGFEIRDIVTHLFAQGFPKSLDVSKAIDKAAGAKREVIGDGPHASKRTRVDKSTQGLTLNDDNYVRPAGQAITAPATDAARAWDGWGTALKPASEHWILVRKPLVGTVAANVLAHGTGAINIDDCRIATDWSDRSEAWKRSGHSANPDAEKIAAPPGTGINCHAKGRWPANLVLSHESSCVRVGTKRVRANGSVSGDEPSAVANNVFGERARVAFQAHGEGDGTEEVEAWSCVNDCPVRLLDEQSGECRSAGQYPSGSKNRGSASTSIQASQGALYTDFGGASRFFYCAKASRSERGEDNDHPTVKSTELMRYLIRLVTPKAGTVIDITMGSGSTGVAALAEGRSFVGIDLDEKNVDIARRRLQAEASLFARTA